MVKASSQVAEATCCKYKDTATEGFSPLQIETVQVHHENSEESINLVMDSSLRSE